MRWALPITSTSPPGAVLIASIRSMASPSMMVLPDQLACSSAVEKTSLGLVFIREAMAGSLAWAWSVGQ